MNRLAPRHVWAVPAALTLVSCLVGAWHQVLWQDELATYTAATRSFGDLVDLARERDAVLTPYYAFMHVWTEIFGASPVSLRIPSALSMAGAAAATALIGARAFGPRAGLLAGLLFAVLPTVAEYGQEARPYAFAILFAAVATLFLLRALERPTAARWAAYALAVAALGAAQLTALAVVAAHGVIVALEFRRSPERRTLLGWAVACAAAAAALAPLVYFGTGQTEQLAGVQETSLKVIGELPSDLVGGTAVAVALFVLAVVGAVRSWRAALPWLALTLVPVVVFLLVSIEQPVVRSRYLLLILIGVVVLAGAALADAPWRASGLALAAVAALGLSPQIDLRGVTLNDKQPDYREVARIIEAEVEPGDAIVMPTERGIRFRIGLEVYFDDDSRPDDVLATRTPAEGASLDAWECVPPTCIGAPRRVWVGCDRACGNPLSGIRRETANTLEDWGYGPERVWQVQGGAISLFTRPLSPSELREPPPPPRQAPVDARAAPNFIIVMTDDQDPASLSVMRHVQRDLGARGVTFQNAFASAPECCPSRVSLLTGQYVHNHGVISNEPPTGGHTAFAPNDANTLPVWLEDAGYRTGYVGKYLNGYGWAALGNDPTEVPPGWTHWAALTNHTEYQLYDYSINENGRPKAYGDAPADYQTDVLARQADAFIKAGAEARKPFFLVVAPAAPHEEPLPEDVERNPRPAPRHEGRFEGEPLPRGPAFGERNVSDKPGFIRRNPRPTAKDVSDLTLLFRSRRESLLAVDDMVHRLVRSARRAGELTTTTFVFTSDNGFLLGEHRQEGKMHVYEESAGVPLVIRGPGFSGGVPRNQPVSNVDLVATIVEQSGVRAGLKLDGVSLLPVAANAQRQRPPVLIEMLSDRGFEAIRTPRFVLAQYANDGVELYDLERDPHQLENRGQDPRYRKTMRRLGQRLARLQDCAGTSCR